MSLVISGQESVFFVDPANASFDKFDFKNLYQSHWSPDGNTKKTLTEGSVALVFDSFISFFSESQMTMEKIQVTMYSLTNRPKLHILSFVLVLWILVGFLWVDKALIFGIEKKQNIVRDSKSVFLY
jgi:hypothetical protein